MRLSIAVLLSGFALSGCGTGPCASSFDGHWIGTTLTDSITLGEDCSFRYHGADGCQSDGTSSSPIADQGTVKVSIDSSTGGACLPAGDYVCSYTASPSTLTFNCGLGASSYSR